MPITTNTGTPFCTAMPSTFEPVLCGLPPMSSLQPSTCRLPQLPPRTAATVSKSEPSVVTESVPVRCGVTLNHPVDEIGAHSAGVSPPVAWARLWPAREYGVPGASCTSTAVEQRSPGNPTGSGAANVSGMLFAATSPTCSATPEGLPS